MTRNNKVTTKRGIQLKRSHIDGSLYLLGNLCLNPSQIQFASQRG
uniref:Uncharacterized protein n=1 Tax=Amphimedon queenslandica TaxID=400682 RepID=A0A1X7UD43_AMPQE